jgi:hypothetical protein
MPVKLGLAGAGAASSALGGSGKAGPQSTKNVTSTNTGTSGGTNTQQQGGTATPNLNPTFSGFQQSLVPALSNLYAQAQTPVYGNTQIAQVANQGDAATNAASNALSANLARRGALNSGANAAGQTALQAANVANTVGFENQIPLLNEQTEMNNTSNVLGLAEGLTGKALSTNTTTGTGQGVTQQNQWGSGNNTTTETGPAFGASALNSAGKGLSGAGTLNGNPIANLGAGKG